VRPIHIITPEYHPNCGGVADYTQQVARGLADAGDEVHVWAPANTSGVDGDRFVVHAELGSFRAADLAHADRLLDRFAPPRRLLVQWVPHGYGFRAMNLRFCLWLWTRARRGDQVEVMVHEPYLAFWEGTWRQTAAAGVHRLMTGVLLRAAHRVWVAIPAWETMWRPYTIGRDVRFSWLPVPSGLSQPATDDVIAVRTELGADRVPLVGHLGTYGTPVAGLLKQLLPDLLRELEGTRILLMGVGSETFRAAFAEAFPQYEGRVMATGVLPRSRLAAHVAACDLLVQPYPDGVSSRRTTAMAGLHLGVPIVTTTGRLTEPFWEMSNAVRVSQVGDCADIIENVRLLLANPDERRQLIETARQFYERMFDLSRTVAELRSVAT
jgi:glycosyltransferase involved in cell wall biosynthesis